jgi:hypothetical protein
MEASTTWCAHTCQPQMSRHYLTCGAERAILNQSESFYPCTVQVLHAARRCRVANSYRVVLQAMLDTEGIDAWDQTGQYSVQIFSLAVLLSSLFVYNQMGGIDEAALDRLSLVTEMTKHIRVRAASKGVNADMIMILLRVLGREITYERTSRRSAECSTSSSSPRRR